VNLHILNVAYGTTNNTIMHTSTIIHVLCFHGTVMQIIFLLIIGGGGTH